MDKGNSLSLPTGSSARQHLGSKKKSDSKNVHPGYSMFEWNVLCESGQDLTGVGGKLRKITLEELEKHSTEKDAWTAVRGKVYNMTHFMRFHPGGKAQLMRGAGNDCTELFDKIHVWVNSEHIMEKCLVGILDTPRSSQTHSLLSVMGGSAALTSTPSESGGDLSFTVPTLTTPTSTPSESGGDLSFTVPTLTTPQSTDKDTLPLHMLRQANIQTHDSVEEDIRIQVPSWIQPSSPLVPAVTTISEIGTSVDPPWLGYETAV